MAERVHQKWTSHFRALRKATLQTHGKPCKSSALPRETAYHRATGLLFRGSPASHSARALQKEKRLLPYGSNLSFGGIQASGIFQRSEEVWDNLLYRKTKKWQFLS
jgi:hypothetical protein